VNRSVPVGAVRPLGDRAFLIGVADPEDGRALAGTLAETEGWPASSLDVVCGFATVMVAARDPDLEVAALDDMMHRCAAGRRSVAAPRAPGREVVVSCAFDGPDLDDVGALAGLERDDVVDLLCAARLTVSVMGFSPGFAYLDGLPDELRNVARRARPRPAVPAGSVALANGHAAVYPTASPGGWQLVGRTAFPFFTPTAPPYAALAPGDVVRFTVAGPGEPVEPVTPAPVDWPVPEGARTVLEVVAPGLRAVFQDEGRRGVASLGVPNACPADPDSFLLANRLVGNRAGAGALEITGGGTRVRCRALCHVAVVGGAPDVRVDGAAVPAGRVVPLAPGQLLEIVRVHDGLRAYLGVAGGLYGPEVLASLASDELCGLGPGPLQAGRVLFAGPWEPPLGDHLLPGLPRSVSDDGPLVLRVVAGPHGEHFGPDVMSRLRGGRFRVGATSNRVGLRLEAIGDDGGRGESVAWEGNELDSQGVVTGVVQIPPGGEPVVLGPDHATLGGYPVAGVVAAVDHALLGQCAPGCEVRLELVELDQARHAWRAWRRTLDGAVQGHYPVAAG
jgi:KipI family sensor histidine kinase inhibitor